MANPSTRWDFVPVFGVYLRLDDTPSAGRITFTMPSRVTRADGRVIYPEGASITVTIGDTTQQDSAIRSAVRAAWRAADEASQGAGFDGVAWDTWWDDVVVPAAIFASFPAADDPDIVQQDWSVSVSEGLVSGKGRSYAIQPLLAQLDQPIPGINLGTIEVPPGSPTVPAPMYAKGIAGGVAALDADGDVVDAGGNKIAEAAVEAAQAAQAAADRAEALSLVAIQERPAAPAPLLTGGVAAETVVQAVLGLNPATGVYYGHSTSNGHYVTSTDLTTWTDRTYSPSTYTPSAIAYEFDATYMYAYSSTGRAWRAPIDAFNAWVEITPPALGPLTSGRVGSLCAMGSGVVLYGNYTSAGGDGAHVWRSTDAGASWSEVLTLAAAKHVHAIRLNPATGVVWCSVGDAGWPGLGLYKSTDAGLTWTLMSSNDYGIDMVFTPAQGEWPALVILEGDGLNRPHLMAFPQDAEPGEKTVPLVWGWSGGSSDPLSWRGTARGLALLPDNHLIYYTTPEGGATGSRSGVWLAEAPNYSRSLLLRETTGAEPSYGRTFVAPSWVQNLQRRYPLPTLGSY